MDFSLPDNRAKARSLLHTLASMIGLEMITGPTGPARILLQGFSKRIAIKKALVLFDYVRLSPQKCYQ